MFYDFALQYAEGDSFIAALYLIGITLIPMMLAAYHQATLTTWSRSAWFWASFAWAVIVLLDVAGIPLVGGGNSLPQIASR